MAAMRTAQIICDTCGGEVLLETGDDGLAGLCESCSENVCGPCAIRTSTGQICPACDVATK